MPPAPPLRELTFSWDDPAVIAAEGAGRSGLEFLRPVTVATGPVTAEGRVVHLGRRTALAEAKLTDDAGRLYVTATSSCLVIRPDQAGPAA